MNDTARSVVAIAARRHGRELAALAYLVLQNRNASEAAAAAGLADVLRADPDEPGWTSMVGAVLRRALEAHGRIREIDAPGEATPPALTHLTPLQRAVAGGHLVAGVSLEDLAAAVGMPVERVRRELAEAEDIGINRERLRSALVTALAGRAFAVAAGAGRGRIRPAPTTPGPALAANCVAGGQRGRGRRGGRRAPRRRTTTRVV